MSQHGYKVCQYRNVAAAFRRFYGAPRTFRLKTHPLERLLDLADTVNLVIRKKRRPR